MLDVLNKEEKEQKQVKLQSNASLRNTTFKKGIARYVPNDEL